MLGLQHATMCTMPHASSAGPGILMLKFPSIPWGTNWQNYEALNSCEAVQLPSLHSPKDGMFAETHHRLEALLLHSWALATLRYINAAFQNPALSITSLDLELEKAMATHSSTLAWKIPWTEVDGGAWKAVVHGVAKSQTRLSDFTFTFMHWRRKWQPTPVFLPGESQGRRSLVGCRLWGRRVRQDWSDLAAADLEHWVHSLAFTVAGCSYKAAIQGPSRTWELSSSQSLGVLLCI